MVHAPAVVLAHVDLLDGLGRLGRPHRATGAAPRLPGVLVDPRVLGWRPGRMAQQSRRRHGRRDVLETQCFQYPGIACCRHVFPWSNRRRRRPAFSVCRLRRIFFLWL
ncbi:hypothetical protein FOMPIDRAFT_94365, partial [Fomitopsis schrenkii]